MGVVNQLGKFTPHIAELSQPLTKLLTKNCIWTWGPSQAKAFQTMKEVLAQPQVLAWYDPNAETKVSADATAYGLGTVLLQKNHNQRWTPVAYASRSLTDTQTRYAQIEKAALAATWVCERFTDYIMEKQITIETDHKPLVPCSAASIWMQFRPEFSGFVYVCLMRFSYSISHVPGKELYTTDALSQAPQQSNHADEQGTSHFCCQTLLANHY